MKLSRLLFFLAFLLIISTCKKDDEPLLPITFLTYEGDSFINNPSIITEWYLFVTDSNGNVLGKDQIFRNETAIIEGIFDFSNNVYNATLMRHDIDYRFNESGERTTFIETFLDVTPQSLNSEKDYSDNFTSLDITLTDCGPQVQDIVFNGGIWLIDDWSEEENLMQIITLMEAKPYSPGSFNYSHAYVYWKDNNESEWRYMWDDKISATRELSVPYDESIIISNSTNISFPQNDDIEQYVYGSLIDSDVYFKIGNVEESGLDAFDYFYPESLFDNYVIETEIEQDDKIYFSRLKHNDFPSNFNLPNLEFETNYTALDNYQIIADAAYDYFEINMTANDNNTSIEFNIYGQDESASNINLTGILDQIPEEFQLSNSIPFNKRTEIRKVYDGKSYQKYVQESYTSYDNNIHVMNRDLYESMCKWEWN